MVNDLSICSTIISVSSGRHVTSSSSASFRLLRSFSARRVPFDLPLKTNHRLLGSRLQFTWASSVSKALLLHPRPLRGRSLSSPYWLQPGHASSYTRARVERHRRGFLILYATLDRTSWQCSRWKRLKNLSTSLRNDFSRVEACETNVMVIGGILVTCDGVRRWHGNSKLCQLLAMMFSI